jgi:hypothetical protein
VVFLQWCLQRLELRWVGYRKVRRLVGKRLRRRLTELGLLDLLAYRSFLISAPEEWARLGYPPIDASRPVRSDPLPQSRAFTLFRRGACSAESRILGSHENLSASTGGVRTAANLEIYQPEA